MGGAKTRRLLETSPREAPVAFQLFGSEPEILGEACRMLDAEGAVWVDLNVGCPVKKFIKNRAGSSLLRDLPHAGRIVRAMRKNFSGTLSVKMRTGWDAKSIVAPEFARIAVDEGAELISVHGRTRAQQYTGRADREHHPPRRRGGTRSAGPRQRRHRYGHRRLRDARGYPGRGGHDWSRRHGKPMDLRAGAVARERGESRADRLAPRGSPRSRSTSVGYSAPSRTLRRCRPT